MRTFVLILSSQKMTEHLCSELFFFLRTNFDFFTSNFLTSFFYTCRKTAKTALKNEIRKIRKKIQNENNFATYRIRTSRLVSHALDSRPRTLNCRQTRVTNNTTATYANKLPMPCSKSGTKYS